QLFYRVKVPAGQRAIVTAFPRVDRFPGLVVRVLDDCGADRCETARVAREATAQVAVAIQNASNQEMERIVAVSAASGESDEVFDLNVVFVPINGGEATPL